MHAKLTLLLLFVLPMGCRFIEKVDADGSRITYWSTFDFQVQDLQAEFEAGRPESIRLGGANSEGKLAEAMLNMSAAVKNMAK